MSTDRQPFPPQPGQALPLPQRGPGEAAELNAELIGTLRRFRRFMYSGPQTLPGHKPLTIEQFRLLTTLQGGAMQLSALAQRVGVTEAAVHRLVARLASRGIVRRETSPAHRRRVIVELTGVGRRVAQARHKQTLKRVAQLTQNLTDRECTDLARGLYLLSKGLRGAGPQGPTGRGHLNSQLEAQLLEIARGAQNYLKPRARERNADLEALTLTQLQLMGHLAWEGPLSMSTIARAMGVAPPTATGMVERLVRRGIAERLPSLHHRLVVLVKLTEKGQVLQAAAYRGLLAGASDLTRPLDRREAQPVARALAILNRALEAAQ